MFVQGAAGSTSPRLAAGKGERGTFPVAHGDLTMETGNEGHWEGQAVLVVPPSSPGEQKLGVPKGCGGRQRWCFGSEEHTGPWEHSALSHHHLPSQLRAWMAPSCSPPHPQILLLL